MVGLQSSSILLVVVSSSMVSSHSTLPRLFPADFRVHNLNKVVKAFDNFPGLDECTSTTINGANPNGDRTGYLTFWLFLPDNIKATNTMAAAVPR
jgi:hypothetical protein